MANIETLYDLSEVGKIVKLSRITLYKHINAGKLKAVKIGRNYQVKESDLKNYIEKGHS